MARRSDTQKAETVLGFLLALRNPAAARALVGHGFTNADLEEGWRLLRRLGPEGVEEIARRPAEIDPAGRLADVDGWVRKWAATCRAVFARKHPTWLAQLNDALDQSLTESPGGLPLAFFSVLDAMSWREGGAAARASLRERGLTKEEEERGRELFALIQASPNTDAYSEPNDDGIHDAWAWYLEWSAIARTVITDRQALRALGFAPRGRRPSKPINTD